MTKQEYEELRSTINSVGEYFKSIEELTVARDIVNEVDASNNLAMLDSPVKLDIKVSGEKILDLNITKYLDAETIHYIRIAILRGLNGRIAFFKKKIEDINYTKR